jgi:hypothetical protein
MAPVSKNNGPGRSNGETGKGDSFGQGLLAVVATSHCVSVVNKFGGVQKLVVCQLVRRTVAICCPKRAKDMSCLPRDEFCHSALMRLWLRDRGSQGASYTRTRKSSSCRTKSEPPAKATCQRRNSNDSTLVPTIHQHAAATPLRSLPSQLSPHPQTASLGKAMDGRDDLKSCRTKVGVEPTAWNAKGEGAFCAGQVVGKPRTDKLQPSQNFHGILRSPNYLSAALHRRAPCATAAHRSGRLQWSHRADAPVSQASTPSWDAPQQLATPLTPKSGTGFPVPVPACSHALLLLVSDRWLPGPIRRHHHHFRRPCPPHP